MLRIRQRKWGYWLFDVWVVAFSSLVIWGLVSSRQATKDIKDIARSNHQLILENRHNRLVVDRKICLRINNLNAVIVGTLQRTRENLPKIQYYKDNPAELKQQIIDIEEQQDKFKPRKCPSIK